MCIYNKKPPHFTWNGLFYQFLSLATVTHTQPKMVCMCRLWLPEADRIQSVSGAFVSVSLTAVNGTSTLLPSLSLKIIVSLSSYTKTLEIIISAIAFFPSVVFMSVARISSINTLICSTDGILFSIALFFRLQSYKIYLNYQAFISILRLLIAKG